MKLLFRVKGVKNQFDICCQKLFCIIEDAFSAFDFNGNLLFKYTKGQSVSVCAVNNQVITHDLSVRKGLIFNGKNLVIEKELDYLIEFSSTNRNAYHLGNMIFPIVEIEDNAYRGMVDVMSWELLKKFPFRYGLNGIWQILSNETFLSRKDNILTCHPLSTGEEKWRIDIGSIMKCEHFSIYGGIHEFNGKLYFFVAERHTDNKSTLCIDIETGALIQKLDNYIGWLYLANDRFYIVSDTAISILNPDTFAVEEIDISAIMKEHDWIIAWDKFIVKDHFLYFATMNIGSNTKPYVGVINMQERKLLWSQAIEVEQSWQNVSELRVQDNRLYVLTHDNTLHIFEEELPQA